MGLSAVLPYPVCFLLAAIKVGILQYRFVVLSADGIGDFSELVVVGHMVFKLPSGFEGNRVDHKMVVQRIGVQMGSDYDLVILSPHLLRRFHSNFVRFLRCDLAGFEALVPMVSHIPSHLPKLLLGGDHCSVGVMLGAVDGADIHFLVGLFIVLRITQCPVQIIVQILLVGGFVRVFRIVDDIF